MDSLLQTNSPPGQIAQSNFFTPNFSSETNKTVWFNSCNSFSIVNLQTLDQKLVEDLIPQSQDSACHPKSVIAEFDSGLILILYEIDQDQLFVFYDESCKRPVVHIPDELFGGVGELSNMELSSDNTTGFIAGS